MAEIAPAPGENEMAQEARKNVNQVDKGMAQVRGSQF
jgi:hypothetical protein